MADKLHKIICSRSGLEFEAETRRLKVHPQISYYTAHKNTDIRYPAIKVIEQGKAEGWNSIEKFLEEINLALNPPPAPKIRYNLECAWVAKVNGYHPKYDYEREFLDEVDTNGRFKRFLFTEPGLYQSCYKSAKGNESRQWWLVAGVDSYEEIKIEQVKQILGENPYEVEKLQNQQIRETAEKITSERYLGSTGELVKAGDRWVKILDSQAQTDYEDEDGIVTSYPPRNTYCVAEHTTYTYWVEAVDEGTASQLEQNRLAEVATKEAGIQAVNRAKEIAFAENRERTETASPTGIKISIRDKALAYDSPYLQVDTQAGLLWTVIYNGRDGDLWSLNNYGNSIATCQPLTPELEAELSQVANAIQALYPEAVQ